MISKNLVEYCEMEGLIVEQGPCDHLVVVGDG